MRRSLLALRLFWADSALLLAAALWGGGFVAQRLGMRTLGPFAYNAARFALGAAVLALGYTVLRGPTGVAVLVQARAWRWGALAGLWLFAAASAQQIGLVTTSAGKAGLLTSLYTVWVYLMDRVQGRARGWPAFLAVVLATLGLILLNTDPHPTWSWNRGDAWLLFGSVLWAVHIHWIDQAMKRVPLPGFALAQYTLTALLSGLVAGLGERPSLAAFQATTGPILYGGLLSVGVAYTLQVVGQRYAPPTHSALLLSMEAVFGVLAGMLFLRESLTLRAGLGGGMVFAAVLLSAWAEAMATNADKM